MAKVHKKSTAFLYIAKRNHMLCTLYVKRRVNCVFYSISSRSNEHYKLACHSS